MLIQKRQDLFCNTLLKFFGQPLIEKIKKRMDKKSSGQNNSLKLMTSGIPIIHYIVFKVGYTILILTVADSVSLDSTMSVLVNTLDIQSSTLTCSFCMTSTCAPFVFTETEREGEPCEQLQDCIPKEFNKWCETVKCPNY